MKIVLCNKYFFLNGGTERYLSHCLRVMGERGHVAALFSVAYAGSWESEYSRFFLPPAGGASETHYNRIRRTPGTMLKLVERCVYSFEARGRLSGLLDHLGGADVGYVLNVCNYMSPSVVHTFRKRGVPVVVRFGDYHPLCANYSFLRDGKPCVLCNTGRYYHGLIHRCVKGSLGASALRVFSMYVQRWLNLYRGADAFVVPCAFMRDRLVDGGFDAGRIHIIRQPAPEPSDSKDAGAPHSRPYVLFFGRVSPEKGLDTLVRAYQTLNPDVDLVLIGRSYEGTAEQLAELIRPGFEDRIHIKGFMDGAELANWVRHARFTLLPSRWYDNAPLATYESYVQSTPVLGADIGGIPEQIRPGETGLLFRPDDEADLAARMAEMLADPDRLERMGEAAYLFATTEAGLARHMDQVLALFQEVRGKA